MNEMGWAWGLERAARTAVAAWNDGDLLMEGVMLALAASLPPRCLSEQCDHGIIGEGAINEGGRHLACAFLDGLVRFRCGTCLDGRRPGPCTACGRNGG